MLRQFYSIYMPTLLSALGEPASSINSQLLVIELLTAFLPLHGRSMRSLLEGKHGERVMDAMGMMLQEGVSSVLRCGK